MNADSELMRALKQNAAFSGISGLVLLLFPEFVARFLGVGAPWFFQALGVGLLLFAADLIHQTRQTKPSPLRAMSSALADFAWVLGTAVILLIWGKDIAIQGWVALVVIALIVAQFGIRQWRGARAIQ